MNFKNLVKLSLKDNLITDEGIKLISSLENIEEEEELNCEGEEGGVEL